MEQKSANMMLVWLDRTSFETEMARAFRGGKNGHSETMEKGKGNGKVRSGKRYDKREKAYR